MSRPSYLLWLALIMIFLLPTAAGRFLLDLAGGLLLALLALPILITGVGWLGWRFIQSRMVKCEVCGTNIFSESLECPACGSSLFEQKQKEDSISSNNSIPASAATIDITAKDADINN